MSIELLEQLPPIFPLEFFSLSSTIRYAKEFPSSATMRSSHMLMNSCELLGEEQFAQVMLAWNQEGIYIEVAVDKAFEKALYPQFSQGDALELFFDTRDLKTAGFATRFCHHFLVLAEKTQSVHAQEITHLRTEDSHPLCDPNDITVTAQYHKQSYTMRIFLPAHCLHGYDPQSYDRMGFTYRIHRYLGAPQHFALSSLHFPLEHSPRLWASLTMVKK